jgi:hypothetical protein
MDGTAPSAQAAPPVTPPANVTPPAPGTPPVVDPAQAATTPNPPAGDENEPISLEAARKLRSEAASLRQRLAAAEKKSKEYEDKELSEADKAKRDLEEANKKIAASEAQTRSLHVRLLAKDMNVVDPEAAEKLIDWSTVEDNDAARKKALEDLVKARPWLAGSTTQLNASTSATNPARTNTNAQTFTRSQYRDRKFYEANREALELALREGRITEG